MCIYLGASDCAISLSEVSVQSKVVHLRSEVANPDRCINLKTNMFSVVSKISQQ